MRRDQTLNGWRRPTKTLRADPRDGPDPMFEAGQTYRLRLVGPGAFDPMLIRIARVASGNEFVQESREEIRGNQTDPYRRRNRRVHL